MDSKRSRLSVNPITLGFQIWQRALDWTLSPKAPDPNTKLHRPRVAVIGAGITGITSAAHCIGHGFDVAIFEAGGEESIGGIWSKVNDTSGLQINAAMYRFHPSVNWSRGYPNRQEIVEQVNILWKRYKLPARTHFHTPVSKVYRNEAGQWIINEPANGTFDGVIAAVGTCGDKKMPHIEGIESFKGSVFHSSMLNGESAKDKKVAIIGGGASAVEALEFASKTGAAKTYILSRSEKWIIPRNLFADILFSLNIWGQETILSWIPETLLRTFFYGDLKSIAPPAGSDSGIFTNTPMVNSDIMEKLRDGTAEWVRCDIERIVENGVEVNRRAQGVPKGGPGRQQVVDADMIIMATGFKRPPLSFLPADCFEEPYAAPNWYLQTFPPSHPSVSAINCTYVAAIGTVGNWHIGIYTRILLMFLVDPLTRPSRFWMTRWIDMTCFLKGNSPTKAFDFFTYLELLWWFLFCVVINPFRWKWAVFVFFGIGLGLPKAINRAEARILARAGYSKDERRDQGKSLVFTASVLRNLAPELQPSLLRHDTTYAQTEAEMNNPVKEIPAVILSLCTRPQAEQEATIDRYFLKDASFVHPFCYVPPIATLYDIVPWPFSPVVGITGDINSRRIVRAIFRWYKILSPDIDIAIDSIAWDEAQCILYVSIHQRFALWFVPFYAAKVHLITELQLEPVGESGTESRPVYYISRQEDHYQLTELLKFVLPKVGPASWTIWQLFSTWLCYVGVLFVDAVLGLFGKTKLLPWRKNHV
ncbi:flavin-binding monooxygenase-like protein [Grosmannia clavigera kw1407]|uniref:Flavin-binding monooxygenase-like protein n=1 Tax=Grosmannia clavigera (strain kw1407 / UAMH 11150) TaxID=655863 RepID=F0XNQ2_GROCL|nr:flavin-binding monooxygenase-like protein [Grosmannia clavigera kw1407]EFX00495.1 flavin-binding monooxygenase-like protein [Grosmannia clavigera kw1407]